MVVAQATIIAFLGIAVIVLWVAFNFTDKKHDILKGMLIVVGLVMMVLTLSITQHFIEADASVMGYDGNASYTTLIGHSAKALTAFIYMIYAVIAYVVIYYVFYVIFPAVMEEGFKLGLVKKSKKRKKIEKEEEE